MENYYFHLVESCFTALEDLHAVHICCFFYHLLLAFLDCPHRRIPCAPTSTSLGREAYVLRSMAPNPQSKLLPISTASDSTAYSFSLRSLIFSMDILLLVVLLLASAPPCISLSVHCKRRLNHALLPHSFEYPCM